MDIEAMARELGLERDEFLEILALFLEAGWQDLTALETEFRRGAFEAAAAAAHSLKGAALNLGLQDIASQARQLEQAAKNASLEGVAGRLTALGEQLRHLGRLAEIQQST